MDTRPPSSLVANNYLDLYIGGKSVKQPSGVIAAGRRQQAMGGIMEDILQKALEGQFIIKASKVECM